MRSYRLKYPFIILLTIVILTNCDKAPFPYGTAPELTIEEDKISCTDCEGFAQIIETDKDHVLISSTNSISIVKYDGITIELVQTIEFKQSQIIISMVAKNSMLFVGIIEYHLPKTRCSVSKPGIVLVYERNANNWDFKEELKIGREADSFGAAIDTSGELLVIGAIGRIPLGGCYVHADRRAYVFRKTPEGWVQEHEFVFGWPVSFGRTIAIYSNLILMPLINFHGGIINPFEVYQYNASWQVLRTDSLSPSYYRLRHVNNNFLAATSKGLVTFHLEPDGGFVPVEVILDYSDNVINTALFMGETIEMWNDMALVSLRTDITHGVLYLYTCYLLRFDDNQWTKVDEFGPDPGESCEFTGLAITNTHVIIGGRHGVKGLVYFRPLN